MEQGMVEYTIVVVIEYPSPIIIANGIASSYPLSLSIGFR